MAQALTQNRLERLVLRSDLAELSRVLPWVEAIAVRYALSAKTVFAIDLCLEEALSNIVRHGYASQAGRPIVVEFRHDEAELVFTVEDEAPHFCPPIAAISAPASLEELTPGGLGIPLMRRFAERVEWEPLAIGNRLTLAFAPRP